MYRTRYKPRYSHRQARRIISHRRCSRIARPTFDLESLTLHTHPPRVSKDWSFEKSTTACSHNDVPGIYSFCCAKSTAETSRKNKSCLGIISTPQVLKKPTSYQVQHYSCTIYRSRPTIVLPAHRAIAPNHRVTTHIVCNGFRGDSFHRLLTDGYKCSKCVYIVGQICCMYPGIYPGIPRYQAGYVPVYPGIKLGMAGTYPGMTNTTRHQGCCRGYAP